MLIKNYNVAGTGNQRTIAADVEWTFPLNFVEVVWSDGKKVDRQVISATDSGPFGTKHFAIPFDATGKAWVRFGVWDSAGNGAFVQPVWVSPKTGQTTSSRLWRVFSNFPTGRSALTPPRRPSRRVPLACTPPRQLARGGTLHLSHPSTHTVTGYV